MTLGESQTLFTSLLPRLIDRAIELKYVPRIGEVLRSDEQAAINALGEGGRSALIGLLETDPRFHGLALALANNGHGNGILMSVHRDGCAVDLKLFEEKEGKVIYLTETAQYRLLGEWWEQRHSLCRWGGRFSDGNHFSIEVNGRA